MLCAFEGKCDHCGHDHGNPFDRMQNFTEQAERITSLESHNRELLAAIKMKDDSLLRIYDELSSENWRGDIRETIRDALSIKPGDVTLSEAMDRADAEWNRYKSTGEGIKFYTIQTKSNTE